METSPTDLNPHAAQMADESMVRNLAAQARAIWPQEEPLIRRYELPERPSILDAGCGTGEISSRLSETFPHAQILGIDVVDRHLHLAQSRYANVSSKLRFEHQSVFELREPDRRFDLTVCRHVLHSIPHAAKAVAELIRVTRSGGYVHIIAEDYGMLHFQPRNGLDPSDFWHAAPAQFGTATGTDSFVGRNLYSILADMPVRDIRIDYIVVDTLRTPRETFAAIIEAWRDGYLDAIAEFTVYSRSSAEAYFNAMIESIRDPSAYAAWVLPITSARVK